MEAKMNLKGMVTAKVIKGELDAPITWKARNAARWSFAWGWLTTKAAILFSRVTGLPVMVGELSVKAKQSGQWIDYGVVSRRLITDAGVAWLVDCWQGTYEPETMKYHACGTATAAEAASDTALGGECTTTLNPDTTRATGTLAEGGAANIFSTVGTLTFDGSAAVTEHGLFNAAAGTTGTLWDRSIFSAINVASGDSIQFTYQCTMTAGG